MSAALTALQTALRAEHAAVFVYGALGAQTSRSTAAGALHRGRRRRTTSTVPGATC